MSFGVELSAAGRLPCIGILGAVPRQRRFQEMGRGAGQLKYYRGRSGTRNFAGGQINDVEVVEINDFLGDHYDPTRNALPFDERLQHAFSRRARHRGARNRPRHSACEGLRASESAHGHCADDSIASQMLPFIIFGGFIFHITGLITLGIYCYLILLVFPADHFAGRIRCVAAGQNHSATDGHRAAGQGSRRV